MLRPALLLACLLTAAAAVADCDLEPADPRAVPAVGERQLSLASLNLWRLRDSDKDAKYDKPLPPETLDQRLDALARHIVDTLGSPHLLALQEVENEALLKRLATAIAERGGPYYRSALEEGHDPSGIDVGALYRAPVKLAEAQALFAGQKHRGHWLFSRPPLRLTASEPLAFDLVVVHLRSGRGLHKGDRVRSKRRAQARALRDWSRSVTAAGRPLVLAGDFNSAPGNDLYGEPLALLLEALESAWSRVPEGQRYSHVYRCRRQAIDHILYNKRFSQWVDKVAVSRGNAGRHRALYGTEGTGDVVSDHDSPVVYLRLPKDEQ